MTGVSVIRSFFSKDDWIQEEEMERRSFLSALTVASLGAALKDAFTESARAQNMAPVVASPPGQPAKLGEFPQNSIIVLVHAAWADGSCWATSFSRSSSAVSA
jgi:hypothetical protein